jgi:DNA-binding PadR family transcriptional regulator
MTLNELSEKLKNREYQTPGELSEVRLELAGWFSLIAGQLEEVLKRKPAEWLKIRDREDIKSDTRADRIYELTQDGRDEILYRLELKRITVLMSGLRTRLEILSQEAKNTF